MFAHGARTVAEVGAARQVIRGVRDFVVEHGELPTLTVVERRRASDGFVKFEYVRKDKQQISVHPERAS